MSWFWIIGIVANVTLTVAAIIWVIRQGKPRDGAPKGGSQQDDSPHQQQDPPSPP